MSTSAVATSIHAVSPALRPGTESGTSALHRGHGAVVGLARADANGLLESDDEDFAVAHLTRPRPVTDGLDGRLDEGVRHGDLEADLLRELHLDRRAPVGLDPIE